jgi:hypothetical protein
MKRIGSNLSRRAILSWTALGVGGLGAAAVSALNRSWFTQDARGASSWWTRGDGSLKRAGFNEWRSHVGSIFELDTGAGLSTLKLVSVTPLPARGQRPQELARDRAFMAVFEGEGADSIGNRTYRARHASGTLDIFMGAAEDLGQTGRLQAVFN